MTLREIVVQSMSKSSCTRAKASTKPTFLVMSLTPRPDAVACTRLDPAVELRRYCLRPTRAMNSEKPDRCFATVPRIASSTSRPSASNAFAALET